MDLNYFRAIQGLKNCNTYKEALVAERLRQFADDFDHSVGIEYDIEISGRLQDLIIAHTNEKTSVFPRPTEKINIGDVLFWNGLHWIVTDKELHNSIYQVGTVERCNKKIVWQNPDTYEIIERWGICSKSTSSNSSITDGKYMAVSGREYEIQVPYDSETMLVDIDKRFMLEIINGNPRTYKIFSVNGLTNHYEDISRQGIITWSLIQDGANHSGDRVDLMLCDYIKKDIASDMPSVQRCEISGSQKAKFGRKYKYHAVFYNSDNVTVNDKIIAKWSVRYPIGREEYYQVQYSGNSLFLSVDESDVIIGDELEIILEDISHTYNPISKKVEVTV